MNSGGHTAYLIDASIYIFRYYFSMPTHWISSQGKPTEAVYGYGLWLLKFIEAHPSDPLAVCFDESLTTCFRHQIYEGYKCSRALPDEALAFQMKACRQLTSLLGIATYASETHEADDLIATLALRCRRKSWPVCIVSRDKDLAQIISPTDVGLWDAPKGECFSYQGLYHKMGVKPEQVADYLALTGDVSDDIPGVPGLGPKTAAKLLQHMHSWQVMRDNFDTIAALPLRGAGKLADRLQRYRDQVDMALQLSRVVYNAPLGGRFRMTRRRIALKDLTAYSTALGLGKNFQTVLNRVINQL